MTSRNVRLAVATAAAAFAVLPAARSSASTPGGFPVAPVTTTIPDDFLTLFPEWSDDNMDYLDPGAHATSLPRTGTAIRVLGLGSAAFVVVGAGLSRGAGSRARRR